MAAVGYLLNDESAVRWTFPELAIWIGDGIDAIVLADPAAASINTTLALQAGTWQTIGSGYLSLLRVVRNLVSAGPPRVGGRAISVTSRAALDAVSPHWHSPKVVPYRKEARQFAYDEDDPTSFYVYPGNDGTGLIEAVLVQDLPPIEADDDGDYTQDIVIPDFYQPALIDYVAYRALSKDAPGGSLPTAQAHFQAFSAAIGVEEKSTAVNSPNAKQASGT